MSRKGGLLVKGTLILSAATLISKILGSLFWIPFQNIAGDYTVGLYKAAFPLYTILLMVATAGIPITVSKFVAERLSEGDKSGARRVLKVAATILSLSGLVSFLLLFLGSSWIAKVVLGEPETEKSLKVLSFALLIVPLMAVQRGYFQGHQNMMPTGLSQVVEQFVRVGTVIALTYWMIQSGFTPGSVAAGATFGAVIGAAGGMLVMIGYNLRDLKGSPLQESDAVSSPREPAGKLAQRILRFAIPISIGSLVLPLIALLDSVTVPRMLVATHDFTQEAAYFWFGVYGRGDVFINVIATFSSALTLVLIPSIASLVAKKEHEAVQRRISQAWLMTVVIGLPSSVGLAVISRPVNIMMYKSDEGTVVVGVLVLSAIFSTLAVTSSGILQGLGYNKLPVRHLFIGAVIKVCGNLVLIPLLGITGSALAMVIAYLVICSLNVLMVSRKTGAAISYHSVFIKPLICTTIMATAMFLSLRGIEWYLQAPLSGRIPSLLATIGLILLGTIVYGVALLLTRTIGKSELKLLPMGDKICAWLIRLRLLPE